MKTSLKNLSDTKIIVTITLDAEALATAEKIATAKLARNVKTPGFRKGKAPVSFAAKNIDPEVLQEQTINNAISEAVAEAFLKEKIQALDRPTVEITKIVPGEVLEFTAETEILPEIKLGDYKKLKTETTKPAVTAKEIDEVIDHLRQSLATKEIVDRPAQNGDEVTIDFSGKKDGVAFKGGSATDYDLTLGSKQFIPGFEEAVIGHKTGDSFDIDLSFPEDYGSVELQGQKVVFAINLKKVKAVVLPEVSDDLATKVGPFKTLAELKADVKRELLSQKEREFDQNLKDDLVKQLISISHVPTPEILIQDQIKSIEQDFSQNLAYQGLKLEQYLENKGFDAKEKWYETEVRPIAISRVQAGLALAELSKIEKLESTAEELEEQVDIYKKQYAKNAKALEQLESTEARRDIANQLVTKKTIERLVELNKIA
jgi:trigger factor